MFSKMIIFLVAFFALLRPQVGYGQESPTVFVISPVENCNQIFLLEEGVSIQLTYELECVDGNTFDVTQDGSLVAYTTSGKLVVINSDGSNRRILFDASEHLTDRYAVIRTEAPQFSADGSQIVFVWNFPDQTLSVISVSTGERTDVVTYPNEKLPARAEFSPDGSQLALSRSCERAENVYSLFSLDVIEISNGTSVVVEDCTAGYFPVWQGNAVQSESNLEMNFPIQFQWEGNIVRFEMR